MTLSKLQPRWFLGLTVLGVWLLAAGLASAEYPNPARLPLDPKGFRVTMALNQFWQHVEETAHSAPAQVVYQTYSEPRYVTIIGPDGRPRIFQIEGPITVVQPRPVVVHLGANGPALPVAELRQSAIHFGANNVDAPVAPRIHFGANH